MQVCGALAWFERVRQYRHFSCRARVKFKDLAALAAKVAQRLLGM